MTVQLLLVEEVTVKSLIFYARAQTEAGLLTGDMGKIGGFSGNTSLQVLSGMLRGVLVEKSNIQTVKVSG